MTYLEAALTILTAAGQPLHYADITRRALEQNLIAPSGLTPEATMGSRLYSETKQAESQFERVGRGIFDLMSHAFTAVSMKRDPSRDVFQAQRYSALALKSSPPSLALAAPAWSVSLPAACAIALGAGAE